MSQTISGSHTAVITLSSADATIATGAAVIANGKLGTFSVNNDGSPSPEAIYGAVFAPASLGTVTIHNFGFVEANGSKNAPYDAGIVIGGTGSLFNTGTITGDSAVAMFGTGGSDYVSNTKLIVGSDGVGLYLAGNAKIANSGFIAGYNFGSGIEIGGTGFVSNFSTGTIAGPGGNALDVHNTGTVINAGFITGYGAGVDLHKGGFISNSSTGIIDGYRIGIGLYNGGTIINSGQIINTGTGTSPNSYIYEGIYLGNNGSAGNAATIVNIITNTGTIIGADYAINAVSSPATITNSGLILSTVKNFTFNNGETSFNGYPDAINLLAGGTVTNLAGGTIGGDVGIFLGIGGSVLNSGSIGGFYYGVYAGIKSPGLFSGTFAASVTNTNAGIIIGAGDDGVELAGGGSVQNAGTIAGAAGGIRLDNSGTVTNSGTVFAYESVNYRGDLDGGVRLSFGGIVNNSGLIKGNRAGIVAVYAAASIINTGSIIGYGQAIQLSNNNLGNPIVPSPGIYLRKGGFISNASTGFIAGIDGIEIGTGTSATTATINNAGTIIGADYGIAGNLSGGTITNSGLILASASKFTLSGNGSSFVGYAAGISLIDGGTIINQSGGSIIGYQGIVLGNTGFVFNAGLISGSLTGAGIYLASGGTAVNTGIIRATNGAGIYSYQGSLTAANTGTIIGTIGALLLGGGTLTDSGTITGTDGDAVSFASSSANRLILDPGASFSGIVDGGNAIGAAQASVLEFASAAAAITFSGAALNSQFIDFASIVIDRGANVTFTGVTTLAAGETLTDYGTITFTGAVTDTGLIIADPATMVFDSAVTGPGTLDVNAGDTIIFNGSVSSTETIDFVSSGGTIFINDPSQFNATIINPSNGTEIFACFAAGTRILTPRGEIAVENLREGAIVITTEGDDAPIKWIGHRTIDLAKTRHPEKAQPIRIEANAIAEGVPARDLYLSPDHALYFENHLIPAKALLNNRNVTQLQKAKITYYHIELATHAAIFAEMTPVETYLETGNRACFENAPVTSLEPDFNPEKFQAQREAESFAPFCESGPATRALRTKLLDRAFINQSRRRA